MDLSTIRLKAACLKGNFLNDPYEREVTFIESSVNNGSLVLIGLSGYFGTSTSFLNRRYGQRDFTSAPYRLARGQEFRSFVIALPEAVSPFRSIYGLRSETGGRNEQ